MRRILQTISWIALAGIVIPPLFFFAAAIELHTVHWWLLVATIAWFVATPMWMGREEVNANGPAE